MLIRSMLVPCFLSFVLLLTGCPHNLSLSISNPTGKPLDAAVQVTDAHGVVGSDIGVGTIQPNGQAPQKFQVDDDGGEKIHAHPST